MGVVNAHDEIGDRELQLMRPQPPHFVARREFVARTEEEQDFRGLRDDELAGFEEWRRVRRMRDALPARSAIILPMPRLPVRATST